MANHSLKITAGLISGIAVAALTLAWPWVSNEIFNSAPLPAQITGYITPLVSDAIGHSPAVKADVSVSRITKLGRGKAEAQVHVSLVAREDFLQRVYFEEMAKARGYDVQGFNKAVDDARSLPPGYAPALLSVPIPTLARIVTPRGTQNDYDLWIEADREGKDWKLSLSPDRMGISQVALFPGTARSSWVTPPYDADSDGGAQAVSAVIEYQKSFIAAVDTAKANYAKAQEEEFQRKQAAAATPAPATTGDSSTVASGANAGTGTGAPPTQYPPKAIIKGKIALCLRASSAGQPDALLVQCDNPDAESTSIHGTVMLINYPAASTSRVGDDVNVPGDFVNVVTLNTGIGNVADAQYRYSGPIPQTPDEQLNALYRQILGSHIVTADALKKVQVRWIIYRDQEAEFEALLAGGATPDQAARQACVTRITIKRVAELQHIALNGISGDLPLATDPSLQNSLPTAYADFFRIINSKQQAPLIAMLNVSEQAWDAFASVQAGQDSRALAGMPAGASRPKDTTAARLASERVDELKALASSMGVTLNTEAVNPSTSVSPEATPSASNDSINYLSADDVGGSSYMGRGHVYSIPELASLAGKNVGDAWLYGSFLLFSQDGSKAMCHPKTAWSIQSSNEVDIEFDQLKFSPSIWQGIANSEKALQIYDSGDVDGYINFANQNPGTDVIFVAKKSRPLRLLRVYRQADGKLVALTKSPGGFREGDDATSDNTANTAPTPNPNAVPFGIVIPESPGFVRSPYAPNQPAVDVRGYASGTQVRCPYTNKIFTIP